METKTPIIAIREKFVDKVRAMEVNGSIDITGKERGSVYTHACKAFPEADFITQKQDGKVYLIRKS